MNEDKTPSIPPIIIDKREDGGHEKRAILLQSVFPNSRIETIPVGDIICGKVCIEIKLPGDFFGSIADGRIFRQPQKMKAHYEYNFIYILSSKKDFIDLNKERRDAYEKYLKEHDGDGSDYDKPKGYPSDTLDGIIASLRIRHNIHVCFVDNLLLFTKEALKLFIKGNDDKEAEEVSPLHNPTIAKQDATLLQKQIHVLTAYPNISEKRARLILSEFPSPEAFFAASPDEISKLKGIGEKIITPMFEVHKTPTSK